MDVSTFLEVNREYKNLFNHNLFNPSTCSDGKSMNYILLATLLVSCGPQKVLYYPKELHPYIQKFEAAHLKYTNKELTIDNLTIEIVDDINEPEHPYAIGFCIRQIDPKTNNTVGTPYIKLKKNVWGVLYPIEREALVFHELGHCILNRPHVEDVESLMNPSINFGDYELDRNYYLKELFNELQN